MPASAAALPVLQKGASELGMAVYARGAKRRPAKHSAFHECASASTISTAGSMPSGWTRWLFEQYEFPFEVVYPQTLDAGNLKSRFDVLVFPDGAMRGGRGGRGGGRRRRAVDPQSVPEEYRGWTRPDHRREDDSADQAVRGIGRRGGDGGQFHQHGGIAGRAAVDLNEARPERPLATSSTFPDR